MPGQRTTPEERAQIVKRAMEQLTSQGGLDIGQIVDESGRNYNTVKTVLHRAGVISGDLRAYSLKNKDRDDKIVRFYTKNEYTKLYEVAAEVGCSVETVRAVLRKNNVTILPSAHIRTPEEIAEAGRKISKANLGRKFY